MQHHKYSLTELDEMIPWEREIYIKLLLNHLEEEREKERQRNSRQRTRQEKNMSDREKFSGDMSRNEVEIDLSKFMEMVTENNELKQKIWELEHDDKKNPWQKYIFLAKAVDSWRIWPRAFLSVYIF